MSAISAQTRSISLKKKCNSHNVVTLFWDTLYIDVYVGVLINYKRKYVLNINCYNADNARQKYSIENRKLKFQAYSYCWDSSLHTELYSSRREYV
jgi:hypothetical protein